MKKFLSIIMVLCFSVSTMFFLTAEAAVTVSAQGAAVDVDDKGAASGDYSTSYGEHYADMLNSGDIEKSTSAKAQIYALSKLTEQNKGDIQRVMNDLAIARKDSKNAARMLEQIKNSAEESGMRNMLQYYETLSSPENMERWLNENFDIMNESLENNQKAYQEGLDKEVLLKMDESMQEYINEYINSQNDTNDDSDDKEPEKEQVPRSQSVNPDPWYGSD